jgi:glutamine synthetase
LRELEGDSVLRAALGESAYEAFRRAKWEEWNEYRIAVADWEVERYLEAA